jgi:hypothetical protein
VIPHSQMIQIKQFKYKNKGILMEPSNYQKLSKEILDDSTKRYCEIYKITNISNCKIY